MNMRYFFTILVLCSIGITTMGKPAYRGAITRTLEDGTKKTVYLHGDEHFHYMTDSDGQWLNEKTLQPLTAAEKTARIDKGIVQKRRKQQAIQMAQTTASPVNIAPRGLLVLVNFADRAFTTPTAIIDSMHNGTHFTREYTYTFGGNTYTVTSSGSARQYFYDQSYGTYNPIFDVVGPVTLNKNMEYYGENNDAEASLMVKEACELADKQYNIDFTKYDNDGDGYVDFVYVIYAGYGEADSGIASTIWPHQWYLEYDGLRCKIDGKTISRYACGNEISYKSNHHDGIGTFCHEFSHVLGLPDLYVTNSSSHRTLCDWDIMDYGPYTNEGNTPPAYSAYERFFLGWLTPRVLTDPEYVWLDPINFEDGQSLLVCDFDEHNLIGNDPNPATFFLLECRKRTGWDKHLPGEGMLITKIRYNKDDWYYNRVNNDPYDMGVDIIEARRNVNNYGKPTDAYPAGSRWWTDLTNHEVSNIALEPDGAITFSYRGAENMGVETAPNDNMEPQKILHNGQVYILRNGITYTMQGTIVNALTNHE